jgi:hypothetical protein
METLFRIPPFLPVDLLCLPNLQCTEQPAFPHVAKQAYVDVELKEKDKEEKS